MPSLKVIRKRIVEHQIDAEDHARDEDGRRRAAHARAAAHHGAAPLRGEDGASPPRRSRADHDGRRAIRTRRCTRCSRGARRRRPSISSLSARPRALRRAQHERQQGDRARVAREGRPAESRSSFATLGRKGREYLARRHGDDRAGLSAHLRGARPRQGAPRRAVARARGSSRGEFDSVYLVYNEFKSAITQKIDARARSFRSAREPDGHAGAAEAQGRAERVPLRADPAGAARAARADVRRDHSSSARCSRARRASSARR